MQIEIVTTKKKLTKSLIAQMRFPSLEVMKDGEVLGFLIRVVKGCYKVILIQYAEDYYILPSNFKLEGLVVTRRQGRGIQSKEFESQNEKHIWWREYNLTLDRAIKQIYI